MCISHAENNFFCYTIDMVHKITTILSWSVPEFVFKEKKPDWYWALAIGVIGFMVIAIINSNFLLGILVLLAGGLFFYLAQKKPHQLEVEVSDQGISVNDEYFSYKKIDSFWIDENEDGWKVLLHVHRGFNPLIVIPLPDDLDPREVRELFLAFMEESEKAEPLVNRLSDKLGF